MKAKITLLLFIGMLFTVTPYLAGAQTLKNFPVGISPQYLFFDGASVWVANYGSNSVTRLRASDGVCVSPCTFNVESEPIAVTSDGAYIWVANFGSNSITQLRASDGACNGVVNPPTATACTISVGTNPRFLAFDGSNIWAAMQGSGNVYKIQATTGVVLGIFNTGSAPNGLAFDGSNIWVTNYYSGSVIKLRPSDGACVINGTIQPNLTACTFAVPNPSAIAFDGSNMWVTSYWGSVTKLRAYDGACLSPCTFNVGTEPIGVASDGDNIWVTNYGSSTVSELRASDGSTLNTVPGFTNPVGLTVDGSNVWVADAGSSQVTKVVPPSLADTFTWPAGDWSCDVVNNYPAPCWSLNYKPGSNPPYYENCVLPATGAMYNVRIDVAGFCNDIKIGSGVNLALNPGYLWLNGGKIDNSGTITNESFDGLQLIAPTTFLAGGGTINMISHSGNTAVIRGNTLVNVDNTIAGQGQIGDACLLDLINQNTITASGTGVPLSICSTYMTNAGVMQAASGGTLLLSTGTPYQVNNALGKITALDTGLVQLQAGTINGGILSTSGSGQIEAVGFATLNNVTIAGAYLNSSNTILQGTITNNGALYAPNGGLLVSGTTILQGTGILSGGTVANVNSPFIASSIPGGTGTPGGVLINQSTITGGGTIGDYHVSINNQGTINATNPSAHLVVYGLPAINSGLMEASGGATLELDTTVNNTGGTITAQSGSFVQLAQSGNLGQYMVSGGTLVADGTLTGAVNASGVRQLGLTPSMTLAGNGTVVGDVNSSGRVNPGMLTIQGNYTQTNGTLNIGIAVCSPILPCHPPLYQDQLAVSKVATLNAGPLSVTLGNAAPPIGSRFTILTASAVNGYFTTTVNGRPTMQIRVPINSNEHFGIVYGQTTVTLVVVKGP